MAKPRAVLVAFSKYSFDILSARLTLLPSVQNSLPGLSSLFREWEGVDWMHLSQYRDQWWVLVEKVMKPSSSIKGGHLLEGLFSMELIS
jgi:hypothetical protein